LDQDIENNARLVDRAPEPVLLAGDADDDLIDGRHAEARAAGCDWQTPGRTSGSIGTVKLSGPQLGGCPSMAIAQPIVGAPISATTS
jgi:hypothetical protein